MYDYAENVISTIKVKVNKKMWSQRVCEKSISDNLGKNFNLGVGRVFL